MKNLNPKSGLKQISSGKLHLPRRLILELIKSKQIKPKDLGYFIMALISADWNEGEYRYGLIRHETKRLAKIWNIPYATFNENLNQLLSVGLLSKKHGSFSINKFQHFEKASGKYANKNIINNEDLELLFGDLLHESEISDSNQSKESNSLKIPYRVKHKVVSNNTLILTTRTEVDYQKIYTEGNYSGLTPDDMKWLDDHYDAHGRYLS